MTIKRATSYIVILAAVVLLVLHYLYLYAGHFGFDDMEYAELGYRLWEGKIDWENHYNYRIIPLLFTGFSYQVFGINDFASAIPSLVLSAGILMGMYTLLWQKPYYLLLAVVVYFSFQWNIYYADKLMPDIYVSSFNFLAFVSYWKFEKGDFGHRLHGFLTAFFLLLAFCSKGTIILMVPFWIFLYARDIYKKRNSRFWTSAMGFGGLFLGAYFFIYFMLTGDALSRFRAIEVNSYFNECSYSQMDFSAMIDRWTTGFWYFLWDELLIIPLLFGVFGLARFFIKKKKGILLYSMIIFILLLSINFMTISISSYNPVCLDPRHIMMVTPVLAFCSAMIIQYADIESRILKFSLVVLCMTSLFTFIEPTKARIRVVPLFKNSFKIFFEVENDS